MDDRFQHSYYFINTTLSFLIRTTDETPPINLSPPTNFFTSTPPPSSDFSFRLHGSLEILQPAHVELLIFIHGFRVDEINHIVADAQLGQELIQALLQLVVQILELRAVVGPGILFRLGGSLVCIILFFHSCISLCFNRLLSIRP